MTRLTILLVALLSLSACAAPLPAQRTDGRPHRIISLDYCADQYVLKLVPRGRILSLSSDATRDFSYLRAQAQGLRQVPPRAEDVLALRPDLVVRSYGGGPGIEAMLKRAGIPVVQLGYADDVPGVRAVLADAARALNTPEQGRTALAQFDARLARLQAGPAKGTALYVTPGGVTGGPGTMINSMLRTAGYRNFEARPGWHPLPLETLAYRHPDLIVAARFGAAGTDTDRWSAARNPVARGAFAHVAQVKIDGATTACGGWFILDAVETIAQKRPR